MQAVFGNFFHVFSGARKPQVLRGFSDIKLEPANTVSRAPDARRPKNRPVPRPRSASPPPHSTLRTIPQRGKERQRTITAFCSYQAIRHIMELEKTPEIKSITYMKKVKLLIAQNVHTMHGTWSARKMKNISNPLRTSRDSSRPPCFAAQPCPHADNVSITTSICDR